jgi:hypothetical protein
MSVKARVDVSVVYHDNDGSTFTVGSLTDGRMTEPTAASTISGTCGTSAVSIAGSGSLSTLAIKNTGNSVLRVAGAIDVTAGRVAVLPVTSSVTVSSPAGNGAYTAVWVG